MLFISLASSVATAGEGGAQAQSVWKWQASALALPDGKPAAWIPKEMARLFKVVEDGEADGGKALAVTVDKRLIRDADIPVLVTPGLTRHDAPVGLYRVTARLKMTGMLNAIGTAISLAFAPRDPAGSGRYYEPTIHGYHFAREDAYQEFSWLVEVVEPDFVTGRPLRPAAKGALGAPFPSKAQVELWKQGLDEPPQDQEKKRKDTEQNQKRALETWQKGTLSARLDLLRTVTVGFARAHNTIQSLTVDTIRIERVPEPASAVVRQVLPQKCWLRPGDEQVFHVWLHNRSGQARSGTVQVRTVHGLNEELQAGGKAATLQDGKYAVVDIPWTSPKDKDLWGCQAVAEWVQEGKTVSSAREVFSVHANPWAVMNHGGASRSRNPYYTPPSYRNYCEFFGISPGDAVKPFPDNPDLPYYSGMSHYPTHVELQKRYCKHNRTIGVATFLYLQPAAATGMYAEDLYLLHPEWFFGRVLWTDQIHDKWEAGQRELVARWQAGQQPEEKVALLHVEQGPNYAVEQVFNGLVEGVRKNLEYCGYDGVRWDGMIAAASANRMGMAIGPGNPVGDLELSAQRVLALKRAARQAAPWYTEGSNIGVPAEVYNRKATAPPPEKDKYRAAFLSDGSSVMDEGWMGAYGYTDPRNVIKDYFWGARQEADYCRKLGGFFHSFPPARDGNPYFVQSIIYYTLLIPLAGGSYPGGYSCPPGSETGLAHFVTRFAEFLYDLQLKPLADAGKSIRIQAPRELWYDETAVWRDLPDGRRRCVVPVVNPPTVERFLADCFSELPEPFGEPLGVEVRKPQGFKGAQVWMLSAEPETDAVALAARADGEAVVFQIPKLTTFCVLVIEFEK
ncbi:MAG: hypothetical protein ABSE73_13920 [Planctomycetota bacterium]